MELGASIVAQHVTLPPATPASPKGAGLHPCYSTHDPAPC